MEQLAHLELMPMLGALLSRKLMLDYIRPWPLFLVIFVYSGTSLKGLSEVRKLLK